MDVISLRLGKKLDSVVEKDLKEFNYSTKTEYIRQAIRELHDKLSTEKAIMTLARNKSFAKRAGIKEPTEEGYKRIRKEVGQKILNRFKSLPAEKS